MWCMHRVCGTVLALAIGTWVGAADAAELEIINSSLKAIHHLYLAPASAQSWGKDLLSGASVGTVAPTNRHTITGLAPAAYDLRLIDESGEECEIQGIEVKSRVKVELSDTQLAANN